MYGEIGQALCRAYTLGFLTGVLHLITMWIDYLGYATMHYCQVMVISFCGGIEFLMMWMNANDGGPLEEAIHETNLTVSTYYVMMIFSVIKCVSAFVIQRKFKEEYFLAYGDDSRGGDYDLFNSDSEVGGNNRNIPPPNQRFN